MPNYVPGIGCFEPKLMIIGEAPGKHEDEQGSPFVGPSGAMLDNYLAQAGIHRSECFITNVVKYRPPFNDLKRLHLIGVDIDQSINELWEQEIKILKPNAILAVGDLALRATTNHTGILSYRGSILRAIDGKTKVIPTIHPAALFNRFSEGDQIGGLSYVYTRIIQQDVIKAVEESNSADIDLPIRDLRVITNSLDLFRFFRQYEHLDKVASDIESINCIPVCVGFAFNRSHAISVPLLKSVGKIELTPMSMSELVECWRIVDTQLRRLKIVGHNFKYDEFKLNLCGFETPRVTSDTLIKLRVLFPELPEKSLAMAASLWTREPYYKSEGKEFKIGKSPINQLFLYNAKDCAVEIEVDEETDKDLLGMQEQFKVPLWDYYYNYMMRKHKFYLKMENNGFAVDHEKQRDLKKKYSQMVRETHAKLTEMVGADINVKSYPQMYQLLYKAMGFRPYKNNPTSEDSIVKLIGSHCKGKDGSKKQQILETVLEERRIRDQLSRYINFTVDYDDRCKSSFNIIATETCRSSTSVPKKPIRPKKLGLAFHTISKHGRLAKDIRSMFIPDKGKVFIQADSSQAEARVVAVLAKDWELLKAFDEIDIHRRTAGLVFGLVSDLILTNQFVDRVDNLEKDGPERFTGKKTRHAGNYNMRKRRFMTEFNTDAQKFEIPMTISEWKAGQMLELFHAASPRIRGVFHQDIIDALSSTRTLIDPFGGVRVFNGRMDEDMFKEGFANIPQRTVSHLVQTAGLNVNDEIQDDKEACFISENHDALVMQVPENNWEPYARLLKKEMEKPIDFNTYCTLKRDIQLVIPADIEISSTNYGDLKKVKL
jgi:uracil-DNA glycosylase